MAECELAMQGSDSYAFDLLGAESKDRAVAILSEGIVVCAAILIGESGHDEQVDYRLVAEGLFEDSRVCRDLPVIDGLRSLIRAILAS